VINLAPAPAPAPARATAITTGHHHHRRPLVRGLTTQNGGGKKTHQAVYLADCDGHPRVHTPFIVGLFNYCSSKLPGVGFFTPIAATKRDGTVDQHVELIHTTFGLGQDMQGMLAVTEDEATRVRSPGQCLASSAGSSPPPLPPLLECTAPAAHLPPQRHAPTHPYRRR
jgi:hypothetical protein